MISFKVRLAQNHGAVAMLLFPHPKDVFEKDGSSYPDTWGLPDNALPRGSINAVKGDPLTPQWPAKGTLSHLFGVSLAIKYNSENHKWLNNESYIGVSYNKT